MRSHVGSGHQRQGLVGLDFGSESARGVLIDSETGALLASATHPYRHGIMTRSLPDGTPLPRGFALQVADDYVEAVDVILNKIARGVRILSIGLGFTASSPLPASANGLPLSRQQPSEPHAYVKLWKHSAQRQADAINAAGGAYLRNCGGRLSGEWLIAKAAETAELAPDLWSAADRYIEAGDWLVWQLVGAEVRSLGFAAYKAQYADDAGYPTGLVPGLTDKLTPPRPIGSPAGLLTGEWCARTGIVGPTTVAVAVIDSHVVLPAVGGVKPGCLVSALGTSAVHLLLSQARRPLPKGIEGMAFDGSVRGLWCYEAGQAAFGDVLAWFVRTFSRGDSLAASFDWYNEAAAKIRPDAQQIVALDWWNGNRVPHADSALSGLIAGLTLETSAASIYRALLESLCFGARTVFELFRAGGFAIDRVILTSGLVEHNPLLVQIMADVLGRPVDVPVIAHPTAVGAAIHGAVADGLVADFAEGAATYGARQVAVHHPDPANAAVYDDLFAIYQRLSGSSDIQGALHAIERRLPNGGAEEISADRAASRSR
ncbi:MAG: carbohydrate kinase [Proteobacteria bacterium]|nr:carbohydrate kinase [Pseudomonadota bacterium]